MRPFRTAFNWLRSEDRLAVLAIRIRRLLAVEKRLKLPGTKLVFGAESWTELRRARHVTETWTAEWVRKLPDGAVLWDVGANIGIFALLAAESGAVAHVVAIEPAFANYASLVRNTLHNGLTAKVTPLPIGLGEATGLLPFNLQNMKAGGSMHAFGEIFPFKDRSSVPAATHGCLSYRLDDLVKVEGIPFPTHIKVDVDGGEAAILHGGRDVLADRRVRGLQIEVMDTSADLHRRHEIVDFLWELGWQIDRAIPHPSTMPIIADLRFVRPDPAGNQAASPGSDRPTEFGRRA